jgi:transposase InsO family protein
LFLDAVSRRLPFPLRALPVDGGSEFAALFAQACQQYGLRPLVLRPRSPTLNARAERGHRMYQALGYLNPQ